MNQTAMNREQRALYDKIHGYALDRPGTRLTFAGRLARDNGWSATYADRVVAEYRRFLFLAAASGHYVSPSKAVDQAWHQHLCDTRDYWERFCPQVLGRPLHHEPDTGTPEDGRRLEHAYRETLASYRRCFGSAPPGDIWPQPREQRPRPALDWRVGRRGMGAADVERLRRNGAWGGRARRCVGRRRSGHRSGPGAGRSAAAK